VVPASSTRCSATGRGAWRRTRCVAGGSRDKALIILGDPAPHAVPITGGSGKYKGVEGEVRVRPASETHPWGILTFLSAGLIGPGWTRGSKSARARSLLSVVIPSRGDDLRESTGPHAQTSMTCQHAGLAHHPIDALTLNEAACQRHPNIDPLAAAEF
jgi:hypothetical protein